VPTVGYSISFGDENEARRDADRLAVGGFDVQAVERDDAGWTVFVQADLEGSGDDVVADADRRLDDALAGLEYDPFVGYSISHLREA
jgi:hypothetical protein